MARIGHIIFNVSDFRRSEAFWDMVLLGVGFTCDHREEDEKGGAKSYRMGEHNIWIKCDVATEHQAFVRDPGLDHMAVFVDERAKVDEMHEALVRAGAAVTRAPREYPEYGPTYYAFTFRDPDGIPLEIAIE